MRKLWWFPLVTGVFWIVAAWFVLGFDRESVVAIAALAGIVVVMTGVAELGMMFVSPGWKWLHGLLGAFFLIVGMVVWINPGKTFFWLSAVLGFYLLFKGVADVVLGILARAESDAWWLTVLVGVIEIGVGFWAAGRFGRSAYVLVVYVAIIALTRGITDIAAAIRLRKEPEPPTFRARPVG